MVEQLWWNLFLSYYTKTRDECLSHCYFLGCWLSFMALRQTVWHNDASKLSWIYHKSGWCGHWRIVSDCCRWWHNRWLITGSGPWATHHGPFTQMGFCVQHNHLIYCNGVIVCIWHIEEWYWGTWITSYFNQWIPSHNTINNIYLQSVSSTLHPQMKYLNEKNQIIVQDITDSDDTEYIHSNESIYD